MPSKRKESPGVNSHSAKKLALEKQKQRQADRLKQLGKRTPASASLVQQSIDKARAKSRRVSKSPVARRTPIKASQASGMTAVERAMAKAREKSAAKQRTVRVRDEAQDSPSEEEDAHSEEEEQTQEVDEEEEEPVVRVSQRRGRKPVSTASDPKKKLFLDADTPQKLSASKSKRKSTKSTVVALESSDDESEDEDERVTEADEDADAAPSEAFREAVSAPEQTPPRPKASQPEPASVTTPKKRCLGARMMWPMLLAVLFGVIAILMGPELDDGVGTLELPHPDDVRIQNVLHELPSLSDTDLVVAKANDEPEKIVLDLLRTLPENQREKYLMMSVTEFNQAISELQKRERSMFLASSMCFGLAVGGLVNAIF